MDFIDRIDPELRDGLALYEALGLAEQDLGGDRIPALRAQSSAVLAAAMADIAPNDQVIREDRTAPGPAGDVPVRIYRPVDAGPALPCLVWMHGGGMIFGTLDAEDLTCEAYASVVGCVVVSVDYRLAPEHPHPAPVEDCYAALVWAGEHADDLGIDPARVGVIGVIGVIGVSAGGGLAAAVTLLARDRGGPAIARELLVYPMLDDR